ncbi:MAG: hypothetical protein ACOYJU_06695 [Anaerovoracaceae bacterium]
MKRKWLSALVAVVMVMAMAPTMAFGQTEPTGPIGGTLAVDDQVLATTDEDKIQNASGEGWTYADGKLTLNGYNGSTIAFVAWNNETLVVQLEGSNVINYENGSPTLGINGGVSTAEGSIVFTGTGTLDINGERGTPFFPINAADGNITFDLGTGGKVRVNVTVSNDYGMPGGIGAYDWMDHGTQGRVEQISLLNRNYIERPVGGVVGVYKIPGPEIIDPITDDKELSSPETRSAIALEGYGQEEAESYATIFDKDGVTPAALVTISGPDKETPDPMPAPTKETTNAEPAGTVTKKATPKTGDDSILGIMALLMVAGAATCVGLARKRFD